MASSISDRTALTVSVATRVVGAFAALYIANEQSYDRTQFFSFCAAAITLATAFPLKGNFGALLVGIGGGLLFFSGAALFEQPAAVILISMGVLAGLAAGVMAYRAGRLAASVGGFFLGIVATLALIVGIALAVEG